MSSIQNKEYEYKVGGSLSPNDPSYVIRQADQELLDALKAGDFCYVLRSRQMGKSSLRVRTMQLLHNEGFACAAIDLTKLGSNQLTADQWYKGIVVELARGFNLLGNFDLKGWRNEQKELSAVQQLGLFLEDILLNKVQNEKVVIFVDEIDSILSLNFSTDDFFALIRFCYEQRVLNSTFNRLTFCLFGVATPSDLISDRKRTPFNIGRAISLNGFQLHEAEALLAGLVRKASNPRQVLKEILAWTGGQPFLTQRLCDLMLKSSATVLQGTEAEVVENLVLSHVIENWEAQDVPEHLRTIRDRVLNDEKISSRLLGLYQKILGQGEITVNDRPDQVKLQLSGLIVEEQGKLKIYNRIYEHIFDSNWAGKAIANLRPYTRSLTAWIASGYKDESRLLRGNALQDALVWAAGKSLSNQDYQFLAASQNLDRQLERLEAEIKLEAQEKESKILAQAFEEANQIKNNAQKKARKLVQIGLFSLTSMLVIAGVILFQAKMRDINSQIRKQSTVAETFFAANMELESLLAGLDAAKQLKQLKSLNIIDPATQTQVIATLHQIVYGIKEKNRLETQGTSAQVWRAASSPDDRLIASSSEGKTVKLWSQDGNLLKTLSGHQGEVWAINFSPDGQILASGDSDGIVKLWSKNGQLLRTLTGHRERVSSINFSPNGKIFATASFDKTVKLWKYDGTLLKTFKGHQDKVSCVVFSPDGQTLATASDDKTIKLWSRNGTLIKNLSGHSGGVWVVNFSSDGQMLASGGADKMVKLWSKGGRLLATLPTNYGRVGRLRFRSQDQSILAGDESNTINAWKSDGTMLATISGFGKIINIDMNFSRDNNTVITANYDGTVRLWNLRNTPLKVLKGHTAPVWGVKFSPDGQSILTTSWDKTSKLWKSDGSFSKTLTGHRDWLVDASFSPDGQIIATTSKDRTVKFWKRDGTFLRNFLEESQWTPKDNLHIDVSGIGFSPDGKVVATAIGQTMKFWKQDGTLLQTINDPKDPFTQVVFSPDGQIIATAHWNKPVRLWKRNGNLITTLKGHSDVVSDISFSPDGQIIATASWDKTIKLWKMDGTLITTLRGHGFVVYNVAFSPDGQILASAGGDRTVKLWGRDGTLLSTLTGHKARVFGVSFSPDGKTLASVSEDKTMILWNLDLDNLMARGCQWIHDYLKTNPNLSEKDRHICDGINPP